MSEELELLASQLEPDGDGGDEAQIVDREKIVADVRRNYTDWRKIRQRHEGSWFLNGAFLRGQQYVEYNDGLARLVQPQTPSYRVRLTINRIRPKIRARLSKFFKQRPRPMVIPASTQYDDVLDARATENLLRYQWDRLHLEEKYKDARLWASIGSKSYWWFRWDETQMGRVRLQNPVTQEMEEVDTVLGDINIEVGSPFEVLVKDPSITRIGQQPAIQRVRMMSREDIFQRYPELAEMDEHDLGEDGEGEKPSQYPDRLANLRQTDAGSGGAGDATSAREAELLVIEQFDGPSGKYPKGRYCVVVGKHLVRYEEELPHGMWDSPVNPYPVVEFTDSLTPGQFWGPTFIEQMVDLQREYNYIRSLISENMRAVARPKIIVYKQHSLAEGAWTNAPGEIVELTWVPGLPDPKIIQPANVAADCWNLLALINKEFDDLTQIYPASEGKVADASSGFQTNLLQEAADSVHAPDVREDELTIQDAAWKIRRICRLGYDVPRLIKIFGENASPELMEFSSAQINEFAEVRVQAGSMLPELKAAKAQAAMELHKSGLFGNPADPLVRRRVLAMLDMNGLDVVKEEDRRDHDDAEQEHLTLVSGGAVHPAQFYEDHLVHLDRHQAYLKSPAFRDQDPMVQKALVAHTVTHFDWVNPALAMGLRQQYGLLDLPIATPPPPPGMPGPGPQASVGAPAQPPPPGGGNPAPPHAAPAPPTA